MQAHLKEAKEQAENALKEVDYLKFELNNKENDILIIREDIQN
jgi:hypothetical protein